MRQWMAVTLQTSAEMRWSQWCCVFICQILYVKYYKQHQLFIYGLCWLCCKSCALAVWTNRSLLTTSAWWERSVCRKMIYFLCHQVADLTASWLHLFSLFSCSADHSDVIGNDFFLFFISSLLWTQSTLKRFKKSHNGCLTLTAVMLRSRSGNKVHSFHCGWCSAA